MNGKTSAAVEREVPDVGGADNEALSPVGPWKMQPFDPQAALIAFEKAAELLRKLVPASIKQTRAQDWVKMGERVYLQATGIERIAPLWGLWFDTPNVTREDFPTGEFAYIVSGKVGSRFTGVEFVVEGGRSSSDPFFDSFDEEKPREFRDWPSDQKEEWRRAHREPVDPLDVRKAAVTNWMTRGASMLTGLRGLKPSDLEGAGITGVAEVQYGSGRKGGDTTPADLKAEQVKIGNEVLKRTGGDVEAAKSLMKDITKGKDFAGFDTASRLTKDWQIANAWKALKAHPVFGDAAAGREPGQEG